MLTHCKIRGYAINHRQYDDTKLQMIIIFKMSQINDSYTTCMDGMFDAIPHVVCQNFDSLDVVTPYNTST